MHAVGTTTGSHFQRVFQQLKKYGFLLESDPRLPSVCASITGESLKSSWWSHPMAQVIFDVNEQLEDHQDIVITKLVAGKVTFVHRSTWPHLTSIGTSRENWQMSKLSVSARRLLALVDERGSVITNELPPLGRGKLTVGDVTRELERKLLILAVQVHTAKGAHAKALETWDHWVARKGFQIPIIPSDKAKQTLEDRLLKLNRKFAAAAKLPWQ